MSQHSLGVEVSGEGRGGGANIITDPFIRYSREEAMANLF